MSHHRNPRDKLRSFKNDAKLVTSAMGRKVLQEKLFQAVFSRNASEIDLLLQKGASPNVWNEEYGVTAVHLLAERDDIVLGARLMKCKGIEINRRNDHGYTPLHIACTYNSKKFAAMLLANGANPNVCDLFGKTPLHVAVQKEYYNMIITLLKNKANVNVLDCFFNSPLSKSIVEVNNILIAKALLRYGANLDLENQRILHIFFETILHCNSIDQVDFVVLLLENGVDVNMIEKHSGRNCLHFVAITGYLEVAIVLIEKGAKLDVVDARNRTPAKAAIEHGNDIIADYFRKGYRPPRLLKALPLVFLWSNKLKARIAERRAAEGSLDSVKSKT